MSDKEKGDLIINFVPIILLYAIALVATYIATTVGIVAFICVTILLSVVFLSPTFHSIMFRKKEKTEQNEPN